MTVQTKIIRLCATGEVGVAEANKTLAGLNADGWGVKAVVSDGAYSHLVYIERPYRVRSHE